MLIFDSGIGGLSILNNIKKILPNINYIYILDNQAFPYGNKTEFFIIERTIKIINIVKKNYPITIAVIACNTASTISLSILKKTFHFPIIGVFPEIKSAEKITRNKVIGLIATKATINSHYIKTIIHKKNSDSILEIIPTNKLALIAEKKIRGYSVKMVELKNIFQSWNNLLVQPDTIILGCTHFSLLKEEIKKILRNRPIFFVDSRKIITSQIKKYFNALNHKQNIKKNILLYSKYNQNLKNLFFFLKKYKFKKIKNINLN